MTIFGLTLCNVAGLRGLHRLLWAALVLLAAAPALALGGNFVVNENATDLVDATPGDGTCADINGKCSLRAAILEGNALAGASALAPHSITFSVTSVTVVNGSLPTMMAPFAVTGVLVTINGNNQGCFSLVDSGTMAM